MAYIKHGVTTVPRAVEFVELSPYITSMSLLNRGNTEIYFTVNGTEPSVEGDDVWIVIPGTSTEVDIDLETVEEILVVRMVSDGAMRWSVMGA